MCSYVCEVCLYAYMCVYVCHVMLPMACVHMCMHACVYVITLQLHICTVHALDSYIYSYICV